MVVADRLLRIRIPIPQSARQLLTCQDRWLKKPDRISRIKTPNGYSTGFKNGLLQLKRRGHGRLGRVETGLHLLAHPCQWCKGGQRRTQAWMPAGCRPFVQ